MGKYDDAIYRYLSDNDRFADLFNAVLFDGEQVLRGELLESDAERHAEVLPRDGVSNSTRRNVFGVPITKSLFQDIRKRARTGESFVVTAIENQAEDQNSAGAEKDSGRLDHTTWIGG